MAVVDLRVPVGPDVALHVRHWAPAQPIQPGFLLVHGLSSNARLWDEVASRLAAHGHPAYAPDLRSHGESDAPATGYDTATAAADVAAVADALGLRGLVVAGQSWGGNVVVQLAARHPDLVAALALVDGGWIDLPAQFDSWQECAQVLRPPELGGLRHKELAAGLRRDHPDWSPQAIEATLANLRVRPDGTLERRLSIDHYMQIVRSMWDEPPGPFLAAIDIPVLLLPALGSDTDPSTQRRRAAVQRAARQLRRATIKEYPGGDHDLHAQQPEAIATDLLRLATSVAVS